MVNRTGKQLGDALAGHFTTKLHQCSEKAALDAMCVSIEENTELLVMTCPAPLSDCVLAVDASPMAPHDAHAARPSTSEPPTSETNVPRG